MNRKLTALLAVATVTAAHAAPESEFAVPVIGHVFDKATRQIRPMAGTPGAAIVGPGIPVADSENALVPGDGSFALIASSASETLQFVRSGETSAVENVPAAFDKAALSPAGTSAALYSSACSCVRLIAELRDTPKFLRSLTIPQAAEVRSIAVDDKATIVAVAIRLDGGSKVLLYTGDAEAPANEVGLWADAVALNSAGDRLLVIESALRKAHILSSLRESPTLDEILTERDGLAAPTAAAFETQGRILVADADAGLFVWNEADRTSRRIECACKPSAVERTATPGIYRLSDLADGAVWLFDTASETPRTFFVPAPRVEASK